VGGFGIFYPPIEIDLSECVFFSRLSAGFKKKCHHLLLVVNPSVSIASTSRGESLALFNSVKMRVLLAQQFET
jgi:hypothetical protein